MHKEIKLTLIKTQRDQHWKVKLKGCMIRDEKTVISRTIDLLNEVEVNQKGNQSLENCTEEKQNTAYQRDAAASEYQELISVEKPGRRICPDSDQDNQQSATELNRLQKHSGLSRLGA